jgi:thiol-disulfide isomerase/thioredoxin
MKGEIFMKPIQSDQQFQEAIQDKGMVVFTTSWCPDCRRLDMYVDELVKDYPQFNWYVVDRDELPDLSDAQEVRGIPSLLFYQEGVKQEHLHSANAKTEMQIRSFLDTLNA